jgi:hypothetical protein
MRARIPIILTALVAAGLTAASVLDLPLASPGQFTASPVNWGPSS